MTSRIATAAIKPRVPVAAEPVAAPATAETPEKRQRQQYVPKTAEVFETELTSIANEIRTLKSNLYPTNSSKAVADRAPTRSELDSLASRISALRKDYKAMARNAEQKPRRNKSAPADPSKPRNGGFKNPSFVDEPLANFIAENFNTDQRNVIDETRLCTRALLTSIMTQYTFDNNLRDPTKGNLIIPDAKLLALFKDDFKVAGVDPAGFPHTHIQKLINLHIAKHKRPEFLQVCAGINIDEAALDAYKAHFEVLQTEFKEKKAEREATRPKPKKAAKKPATETA